MEFEARLAPPANGGSRLRIFRPTQHMVNPKAGGTVGVSLVAGLHTIHVNDNDKSRFFVSRLMNGWYTEKLSPNLRVFGKEF
jgi:hypothetical protein